MIYAFPMWPKTLIGWVSLLVLGLPILVIGEGIGGILTNNKIAQSIESNTSDKKISWKRMAYLFITFGVVILIIIIICNRLEGGAISDFITRNFKV